LYGCGTWSFTFREERRLRVLRRLLEPKRDEVTVEWRKLHNEELNDLHCSPKYCSDDKIEKNDGRGM
jgi:hypothetical protein